MKKAALIFLMFFLTLCADAEVLRGSTSYDEPLKGFFGRWHVTSKIEDTNNYSMFNKLSVDIWNLSGVQNVLILENGFTGAISSITFDEKENLDGKHLKFTRIKEFTDGKFNYRHTETPEFVLDGKIFRGFDTFKVEKFDLKNNLISVDVVKYKVIGQKITGE